MEHWKKIFNPNYIGEWAFESGEEKPVTIADVRKETLTNQDGGQELRWVLHFKENEKPLALNKTNSRTLEKLTGESSPEQWTGAGIILFVQKIKAFGELTGAVRIRPVKPYICADCGGVIRGYGGKSHEEIREHTRNVYKRQLCAECAKKAADAKKAAAPADDQPQEQEPQQPRRRRRTSQE